MTKTTPGTIGEATATYEDGAAKAISSSMDAAGAINDHSIIMDADELRDQMAAQVKATKLSFSSAASMQLCFFLFVAYCSELPYMKEPLLVLHTLY